MTDHTRRQERFRSRYGPWAVVTGASSGIGRETASKLAEAGLNLVLVARGRGTLEKMAAGLGASRGVEVRVIARDLAQETSAAAVEAATRDLDVGLLVAAAGFGTSGPFLDASLEQELEMLGVNCRAAGDEPALRTAVRGARARRDRPDGLSRRLPGHT